MPDFATTPLFLLMGVNCYGESHALVAGKSELALREWFRQRYYRRNPGYWSENPYCCQIELLVSPPQLPEIGN